MRINKLVLTSTVVLSLISTSMVFANQDATAAAPAVAPAVQHQYHKGHNRLLTAHQQRELHAIIQGMNEQMLPLLKEKKSLNTQIRGKISAPKTQWSDIAPLVKQLNENNAKITTLFAKTQLTAFQKVGVLLPTPHAGHSYGSHIA